MSVLIAFTLQLLLGLVRGGFLIRVQCGIGLRLVTSASGNISFRFLRVHAIFLVK